MKTLSVTGRRAARVIFASALFLAAMNVAHATWSVVVVNRSTGEICIASATCLTGLNLRKTTPVMVVGVGGAVAQASTDVTGENRLRMWNTLHAGADAERVLWDVVLNGTAPQTRVYGVVTMESAPAAWAGNGSQPGRCEVFSEVGDLAYSIQGGGLTGPLVCYDLERLLIETEGDLGQKVMAAMEAARALGGDGRCSCSMNFPDGCGAPPDEFEKSAHIAFLTLARLGDADGVCNPTQGCANGDYYLTLDVRGAGMDPDPVLELKHKYDRWRAFMRGVPDHLLTQVEPGSDRLDVGGSQTDVVVRLHDVDGNPIVHGGQQLSLTYTGIQPQSAFAGPVTDRGDGTHVFTVTSSNQSGLASWSIEVLQTPHSVQVHPELAIQIDA